MLCNSVRAVFVGVLFTLSVGCVVLTLRKNSQIARHWRMLRIPTARLPIGSLPSGWQWRSCRLVSPRLFVEPPACLRVNRVVVIFDSFELFLLIDCEGWLCSLAGSLPGARRAIVCILFSLEQSQVVDWVVAEVLLRLAWESNASNFEFSQFLLRRRYASPRQVCHVALSISLHPISDNEVLCVSAFFSICFAWCTFLSFRRSVRVSHHDCCYS